MEKKILERIENILKDNGVNADVKTELVLDSLTFIKVVVDIENQFDIEFTDEMLRFSAFPTVDSIVQYVLEKRTNS